MSFSVQRRRRMMMMMDIQRVRMNYNHSHLAPWISAGASFIKLLRLPLQNEFLMQGNPHRRNGLTTMKVVQLGQLMIVNLTISREMEKILHEFLQCSVLTSVYVALLNWWQRVLVQVLASRNYSKESLNHQFKMFIPFYSDSSILVAPDPGARQNCFSQVPQKDARHFICEFWDLHKIEQDTLATQLFIFLGFACAIQSRRLTWHKVKESLKKTDDTN